MAKVNTNIMNDIAESLKDSTKNLPKEEKEKVENEVLQEVQQKIENQQKQINEATSKTSEELNNYANKVEETENSIASSASKLESANEIPKITSTIDLNARNEKIAIKREERKNNSASSNISKTSDTKTVGTSKETNDAKVVETNEIVDKSSTYNIKNTNITAKEKFKEQQLEEKNSKSNTNTTISQNLKNVEKRIDDIDTKNSNNINNSKTLTNSEISNRLGYIPGTELAIQEYSKATSKKIKEEKSVSNTNSSTDEVPQQKSVREYLQAGPQWSYSDKSPINGYDVLTGVVAASEGGATFLEDVVKGGAVIGEGLITGGDAVYSLIRSIWDKDALSDFKDRTNQRWDDVGTFVSTDYVSNFYEDVIYAGVKDKANHFDTARSIGYSGGYFGAAITSPAKMVSFFAGGDTTVAELSLFEGAAGVLESSVKGVITIEGCNSYFDEKSKKVLSTFLGTNWVGKGFDALYETKLGKLVKDNVDDFDTKRYIGNTAGSVGTMAAISYFTGGTGAAIVGTLSAAGSGTSKALQEGATLEESLKYGTTKGAVTAITFGLSGLGPSKMATTSGQVIKNAGKGVLKRTILGTIEDAADSALRTLYVPRNKLKELGYESEEEWNNASFLEQTNAYFVDSGGAEGLGKRAATNATYSIALEGAAAIKQINSINKVDKLYNEVTNNTREIDDINNKNRLSKSNSTSTSLDDLYAQRQGLANEYKNLNDYEKYLFTLKQTKEVINSGVINTNNFNMDKFIDSGMAKVMYSNLSNQERLALFDAMDEPQIQRYFNQIGGKAARSFVNKNSSYISNRFFNADSASSTWTNSSSLALSSSPSLALGAGVNTKNSSSLMVAYPAQLLPTTKEIGNSNSKIGFQFFAKPSKENNSENGIIARNKFESRVGDIEADYNEAIDEIIDEYYTSLRPDVAVPKEKRAISVIQKKYGNNSDYEKAINLYYDELDDSAKKLSDSFLETYTTNYDSPTALTSSLLAKTSASKQQLAKKIEEIDSLIEEFKTKASYDIFGPHRTNVKVYSGLKEDFMDQYKKVESLESAIKATDKKYVDSVVEKGKELLGESDFEKLDRIFHPQKVEPVTEILEDSTITRSKNLTTEVAKGRVGVKNSSGSTSKIGFQFFANKKAENLYNANDMPLATDPKFRRLQDKMANGESLSMFERASFHDKTYKNIGDYECKPNYCYRAISKEVYDIYKEKGYIVGYDNDKEYQEFVDEDGSSWNNNAGVDWYLGGYAKYGTIIIECPAYKDYFVPAVDGGNHMTSDITVKHMKSSPEQNPIPFSKITRVFDLDQIKVDEAKELSSQGKITKEFTSTLTDEQYKAILLQADENPKLVSDVIAVSHIQQLKNVIRNMDGDEIAKVIDVENIDMGFITRNAINNLDESQVTETLTRKITDLDDKRFIDFVKENTNSTLFDNAEIFDRAISIATKERINIISGLSDEIQSKVLSNKTYVNECISNPYTFARMIDSELTLDNSKLLMNSFNLDNFTVSNKSFILLNISDVEKQNLFIEKSRLFDSAEWKSKDLSIKISDLEVIKDANVRQQYIMKSGVLDNLEECSSSNIRRLLKIIDDEELKMQVIDNKKVFNKLSYYDLSKIIPSFNDENQYKIISELHLKKHEMQNVLSNSSSGCLKKLYENQRYDILSFCSTEKLLTQMDDSKTFLDAILNDVKEGKVKISVNSLLSAGSSDDIKVQYYITIAKHDMIDYVNQPSVDELLKNKNTTTLLTKLLNADKNLTVNKILSYKVKSNPRVATILELNALSNEKPEITFGTEKYNDDYLKKFNSSLGIGPIPQKGESLLNELQELFLNDGKSDKEIVESLIAGYRQGLIVDYDNCVKELQNLVNIKRQNLDKFYYIKKADSRYFKPGTGSIYMDAPITNTSLHETGHALHEYLAQSSTPKNFMEVVENAKKNPEFMKKVEEYYEHYSSIADEVVITAQNEMNTYFKDYYTDEKIGEITKLLSKSREELMQEFASLGMLSDRTDEIVINLLTKKMYTLKEYINTQKIIFISQLYDTIMRSEYGGVIAIGDYIDRITDGAFQRGKLLKEDGTPMVGIYGHGLSYYFGTDHGFDEMVANFASMLKMPNAKENLQMLKGVIGEEMYNMISSYYYKNIINYGG